MEKILCWRSPTLPLSLVIHSTQHMVIYMAKVYWSKVNQEEKIKEKIPSLWEKTTDSIFMTDEMWAFKWKIVLSKICLYHQKFDSVPYLNLCIILSVLINMNVFILYNKMHHHLEDLHNSGNCYFPNQWICYKFMNR